MDINTWLDTKKEMINASIAEGFAAEPEFIEELVNEYFNDDISDYDTDDIDDVYSNIENYLIDKINALGDDDDYTNRFYDDDYDNIEDEENIDNFLDDPMFNAKYKDLDADIISESLFAAVKELIAEASRGASNAAAIEASIKNKEILDKLRSNVPRVEKEEKSNVKQSAYEPIPSEITDRDRKGINAFNKARKYERDVARAESGKQGYEIITMAFLRGDTLGDEEISPAFIMQNLVKAYKDNKKDIKRQMEILGLYRLAINKIAKDTKQSTDSFPSLDRLSKLSTAELNSLFSDREKQNAAIDAIKKKEIEDQVFMKKISNIVHIVRKLPPNLQQQFFKDHGIHYTPETLKKAEAGKFDDINISDDEVKLLINARNAI